MIDCPDRHRSIPPCPLTFRFLVITETQPKPNCNRKWRPRREQGTEIESCFRKVLERQKKLPSVLSGFGGITDREIGIHFRVYSCAVPRVPKVEDMVDFHALGKELEEAIATDEKYKRENEAKFRAVHQKVSSYEEFRDIVLASHLKPLEKKDKMGNGRNMLWNSYTVKPHHKQESKIELLQELECLPKTSAEFYRVWRRYMKDGQERYHLLLQLGSQNLGQIFQTDIAFGLLGEFLVVLSNNACIKDCSAILDILESLSGTRRFVLNVELLNEKEKESCKQLLEKLQKMGTGPGDFPEIPQVPNEDVSDVTQIHCQAGEVVQRKVMELMSLYQIPSILNSY